VPPDEDSVASKKSKGSTKGKGGKEDKKKKKKAAAAEEEEGDGDEDGKTPSRPMTLLGSTTAFVGFGGELVPFSAGMFGKV